MMWRSLWQKTWVVTLTRGDQRGGPSSSRHDLTLQQRLDQRDSLGPTTDITSPARQLLPDHSLVLNVFGPSTILFQHCRFKRKQGRFSL
jgi:hypothetical protein